jgi:4-amino-4-deoxy-L-arabinose transferase
MDPRIANSPKFLLVICLGLLLTSIGFFVNKKITIAVILLFFFALAFFTFAALLDPFLNIWDERFHALVAKNLLNHPFKPTLYDNPVITMAYNNWDRSIIWLHKQPLFLWQIAISFKVFGVNEFALRFPSVLLSSLMVPISYRTGKLLVNQNTGYYTAILVASSCYLFELVSAYQGVDHNDVAFFFYVSASIWAWVEFIHSGKKGWLILIGLFSGFAILNKWLVGLVVYAGWALFIIFDKKNRSEVKSWLFLAFSLLITILVVLPWQLWILKQFPIDAALAFKSNSDHFFRVVEGHDGPWWYYFAEMPYMYGLFFALLIPLGLAFLFLKIKMGLNMKIAILALPILIYLFFSIAQTKITSFPFVIALPVYLGLACIIDVIINKLQNHKFSLLLRNISILVLLIFVIGMNIRAGRIIHNHSQKDKDDNYYTVLNNNRGIFLRYKEVLPANTVIFNLKGRSYIDCMFYTGFPAYNFLPSRDQYNEVKTKGKYTIVVVNIPKNDCPDYLRNDPAVVVLKEPVSGLD